MEPSFEKVLIEALDALEAGDEVEAILARYREHQAELRPLREACQPVHWGSVD